MALPNRLHTATYSFAGGSLKLQATFDALEALKADVLGDPITYIGNVLSGIDGPHDLIERVTTTFFHLQLPEKDEGRESKASIHAWLAGEYDTFFEPANFNALAVAIAKIMGKDVADAIASMSTDEDSPKKTKETSTASEQPSAP
jgi:type IV secretory pathway VirB4 component